MSSPTLPLSTSGDNPQPTRDRLVAAMLNALRRKGYYGVGLSELLTEAAAPKGVLYHHFPGGKSELAIVAIQTVVSHMTGGLQKLLTRHANPAYALQAWMVSAEKLLVGSGFEQGCPLASIALESTPDDAAIRAVLADGFASIRTHLADALQSAGIAPARSANLAALMVSAYEGALLQARVAGQVQAMQNTTEALVDLIRLSLPSQP
jgi:TetR/AcrR family transcriptional repressor of lmrAB and yxaGH operons